MNAVERLLGAAALERHGPRTATGKVQRFKLRELLERELGTKR